MADRSEDSGDGRPHLGWSLSIGGIATALYILFQAQSGVATQDDLAALSRRIDAIDASGTRGLDGLRETLRSLEQRIDDKTDDRFRGTDWSREDRRLSAEIEHLREEVERLRGFLVSLDARERENHEGGQ